VQSEIDKKKNSETRSRESFRGGESSKENGKRISRREYSSDPQLNRYFGDPSTVSRPKQKSWLMNWTSLPFSSQNEQCMRKKSLFDYESQDQVTMNAYEIFRTHYFLRVVDQALQSMQTRFEQYDERYNNFGFLYSATKLLNMNNDDLLKSCEDLDLLLQKSTSRDFDGIDLYNEILLFQEFLKANNFSNLDALGALNKPNGNAASFPNLCIALRILLTMSVTVASAERSFSKLKLIKNYPRTTMSQQRLTSLAVIAIECEVINDLDMSELIRNFAAVTARK
jgi:hypothetical protein